MFERLKDRLFGSRPARATVPAGFDLPLVLEAEAQPAPVDPIAVDIRPTRETVAAEVAGRVTSLREAQRESVISLPMGMSLDPDEGSFRRLSSGTAMKGRDLNSIQQDRMLEISWYLWEANPLAKRLIQLTTDLIVGEGITITAKDERIAEQVTLTWNHPTNQLHMRPRQFYNFLALTGELILPTVVNPFTGRPVFGFIDPYAVRRIHPVPGNILIPDVIELKPEPGSLEGQKLKIIRVNPETDRLEGDVFYFGINQLPNSLRGRSDLLPLADWLDLYDQYLFAEVERLHLLSNFVWDYKIEGADATVIREKLKTFPTPKPGTIFAHNEKETLEAKTPDLKAADRSEVAHMLRVHIAGSMGFPTSYLGDIDSNKATIEGQNDVMMKTPAARQKEFMGFIEMIVRFVIESTNQKNRALFRGSDTGFQVQMPEVQSKDVARVGQVLAQVATAMDTGVQAGLVSKRVGTVAICAVLQHLGVDEDPATVMAEAEKEAEERQEKADELAQGMARAVRLGKRGNPPVEDPGAAAVRAKQAA